MLLVPQHVEVDRLSDLMLPVEMPPYRQKPDKLDKARAIADTLSQDERVELARELLADS